jgi:hypothetical protein
MVAVGLALPPDEETLARLEPLALAEADIVEVAPETLWRPDGRGDPVPNGFHARFLALRRRTGRPFVAHGVGLSPGGAGPEAHRRRRRWMARIAADHAAFAFLWYTDHLGVSAPAGENVALPLPLPMTGVAAAAVRRSLRELASVVPTVGLENTAHHFVFGDPLDEPAFIATCLRDAHAHLLLDLHNVHAMSTNLGFPAERYLECLPLHKVIEIHLAGGSPSRPGWLPERRRVRLDSHDDAAPDEVWRLLRHVRRRCPALRALVIERMEGTVAPADVPLLREELRRARRESAA